MSKYTMQLREVCGIYGQENVEGWFKDYELSDYLTAEEIAVIEQRGTWTKDKLAKQIVEHYDFREIGLETPALFRHEAKVKMRELMEEYAPKIYSASIQYDPLVNVDFEESYNATSSNTGTSNSNSSGLTVNSDTPQGNISKASILSGNYASSTGASESSGSSTATGQGEEHYTKRTKGNSGVSATAQALIRQYRDTIITINRDIIRDLNELFMGIW